MVNLNDPLLMALLAAMQQGQQQQQPPFQQGMPVSDPNIIFNPATNLYTNTVQSTEPPAEDTGEVGGRGFVGGPVMNSGPNPWAGMSPEEAAYNMQINYLRNQGGSTGMSDKEAFDTAIKAANTQSLIGQKYGYTDVLRQNAIEKRASEEEDRKVKTAEGEANRKARQLINQSNLRFKELKMKVEWAAAAKDAIEVFARTTVEDPRTRVQRFPNDKEIEEYMQRLQNVPGALTELPEELTPPPPLTEEPVIPKGETANPKNATTKIPPKIANTFIKEAQTLGIPQAVARFMASTAIPEEVKAEIRRIFGV